MKGVTENRGRVASWDSWPLGLASALDIRPTKMVLAGAWTLTPQPGAAGPAGFTPHAAAALLPALRQKPPRQAGRQAQS